MRPAASPATGPGRRNPALDLPRFAPDCRKRHGASRDSLPPSTGGAPPSSEAVGLGAERHPQRAPNIAWPPAAAAAETHTMSNRYHGRSEL
jgi:hypothetical protein